jgi:hypothetical protein
LPVARYFLRDAADVGWILSSVDQTAPAAGVGAGLLAFFGFFISRLERF